MKTKTIPFDLETAMKIQAGEVAGRITTKEGKDVRIICTDKASTDNDNQTQIVCLIRLGAREILSINDPKNGECWDVEEGRPQHLVLEVPDNEPQFKPFDKVLVRDCDENEWHISFFSHMKDDWFITNNGHMYKYCIPYEGNQHLVGTTDKPKED